MARMETSFIAQAEADDQTRAAGALAGGPRRVREDLPDLSPEGKPAPSGLAGARAPAPGGLAGARASLSPGRDEARQPSVAGGEPPFGGQGLSP